MEKYTADDNRLMQLNTEDTAELNICADIYSYMCGIQDVDVELNELVRMASLGEHRTLFNDLHKWCDQHSTYTNHTISRIAEYIQGCFTENAPVDGAILAAYKNTIERDSVLDELDAIIVRLREEVSV